MKNINKCRDEFHRGEADRRKYPLHRGEYKLKEAHRALTYWRETLCKAGDYQRKTPSQSARVNKCFGACTHEEAAWWLKKLPEQIAFKFGYAIVPAVEALGGDGVPSNIVADFVRKTRVLANMIGAECDLARTELFTRGVVVEYQRMKQNDSSLAPLLNASIQLVERTLQAMKHAAPAALQGVTAI